MTTTMMVAICSLNKGLNSVCRIRIILNDLVRDHYVQLTAYRVWDLCSATNWFISTIDFLFDPAGVIILIIYLVAAGAHVATQPCNDTPLPGGTHRGAVVKESEKIERERESKRERESHLTSARHGYEASSQRHQKAGSRCRTSPRT